MKHFHTDRGHTKQPSGFTAEDFSALYDANPDPWGFNTSSYERAKYQATLGALPRTTYRRGVEPGCANGALTELLAERCHQLTAFDFVSEVVQRATARMQHVDHVQLKVATFPRYWPAGTGDLIVWSEVLYYLDNGGLSLAERGLRRWLEPGGDLVAVHYTKSCDHPRTGSEVREWLDTLTCLERVSLSQEPCYELGVWRRKSTR